MRLGLFGGTFNPIHLGHLRAAEEVCEYFTLDRLLFIPAARPPHKNTAAVTPFAERQEMVRLAVADHEQFEVSDIENQRPDKSYSVDTLRWFRQTYGPTAEIYFIVGLDAMLEIETWREYQSLFHLCHFVVLDRPGYAFEDLRRLLCQKLGCQAEPSGQVFRHPNSRQVHFRAITRLDISSTQIRRLAAQGRSLRYLLPEAVRRYILRNNLYS
ncbi:MAG: nicotinate-nucleotide adenylyltransferase [Desulfobacca sp.]|uniref:nicotinate-nucleotide adenylyltransferase n=1 Tax=Desulfobacca sp. TaxID=2067990 RepID=UPI004048F4E2